MPTDTELDPDEPDSPRLERPSSAREPERDPGAATELLLARRRPLTGSQTAALFLGGLGLVIVGASVLLASLNRLFSDTLAYQDGLARLTQIERLRSTLLDAETGQRGFSLTGDPVYLEPYYESISGVDAQIIELRETVGDNPIQVANFSRLRSLVKQRLAQLEQVIQVRDRAGARAATELGEAYEDKSVMDEIREVLELLRTTEASEARTLERAVTSDRRAAIAAASVLILAASGMLSIAFVFVRRDQRIHHGAKRVLQDEVLARTEQLERANERLRREVAVREAAEARSARYAEELERSNRELNDFAFVASHDLQEPLRKIRAFGDRLDSDFSAALGDRGADYLARMRNAAGRMSTLINDLLAFSRVSTRGKPFEPVALDAIAAEVLEDLEVRTRDTGAKIVVGDLPTIDADPMQMRQLLQNLVGNALKFVAADRSPVVEIRATPIAPAAAATPTPASSPAAEGDAPTAEREESPAAAADDGAHGDPSSPAPELAPTKPTELRWRISVRDNGIGFDTKYLDRIFTPFQRLHGRGEYSGSGIGLAICRRIAERHRGSIDAESAPGEGSTFIVELPARHIEDPEEGTPQNAH